jgi:hypothetical protein
MSKNLSVSEGRCQSNYKIQESLLKRMRTRKKKKINK